MGFSPACVDQRFQEDSNMFSSRIGVTGFLLGGLSFLVGFGVLVALSPLAFAEQVDAPEGMWTSESTRGFDPIVRLLDGTTKTVQIVDFQAAPSALVPLGAEDEMYLRKIYIQNGSFSDLSFNTGGVGINPGGDIWHYFYLNSYERQEHTFDPPIRIGAGTIIQTNLSTGSGAALQITLLGSTDPTIFFDRFQQD
ncbi:hypothetical protein HNQ63_001131 [Wenzhouxiangella marina]|uniref:hypothetical protein n=1 Tax=Wenzhouxiangella marina TaxID=1579979 RepID=UPI0014702ACC|nr:hypothetical protein [Wenzhouxiangella marina]MBB6086694.1 hypothetical protein [Wenzhouxiangella marina]